MSINIQKQTKLPAHKWQVSCLEFSSDGLYLASGGWDKKALVWDLSTLEPSVVISYHSQPVTCLSFQPKSSSLGLLATGSADHTVCLSSPITGGLVNRLQHHSNWVLSTSFSPQGRLLASTSWDKTISICDVETGKAVNTLTGHTTGVWTCSFNPEESVSDTLCSGAEDGSLKLWDIRTKSVPAMSLVGGHEDRIKSCAWSPNAQYLASSSADGKMTLWEPRSGTALTKMKGYEDSANSVKFYPLISDNSVPLLFSVGGHTCNVWHPFRKQNKQLLCLKLTDAGEEIQALGISPDGTLLATGGSDKLVVLSSVDISLDEVDALPIETAGENVMNRGTLLWKKYTRKVIDKTNNDRPRKPAPANDKSTNSAHLVGSAVHRSEDIEKKHVPRAQTPQFAQEKLQAEPEIILQHQRQKLRPRSSSGFFPAEPQTYDIEHRVPAPSSPNAQNQIENARQHLRKVRKMSNGSNVSSGADSGSGQESSFSKVNSWNGVPNGNGYPSPTQHAGFSPPPADDQEVIVSIDSENESPRTRNGRSPPNRNGYGNNHEYSNNGYEQRVNVQPSSQYHPFSIPYDRDNGRIYHGINDDLESTSASSSSYYADIDEVAQEMLELTRQVENHRL